MSKESKSTHIQGNVDRLTQIEYVAGNVILNSGIASPQTITLSSLLNYDSSEPIQDVAKLESEFRKNIDIHFQRMGENDSRVSPPSTITIEKNKNKIEQTWQKFVELDTLHRRSVDSFVEGPSRNEPPQGYSADWVGMIQSAEFFLASIASETNKIDDYNSIVNNQIQEIWSPDNKLLNATGELTAPILYFLTRFTINNERFIQLAPQFNNPFESLIETIKKNVYPVGLYTDDNFLFALTNPPDELQLISTLSTPPILSGLNSSSLTNNQNYFNGGEIVAKFPQQRIDTRMRNLDLQILSGQVALTRHFGYWKHVVYMHELWRTAFDASGFTSLLEVVSTALRQKRILLNPKVSKTLLRIPSVDIVSLEFDKGKSVWYQKNPIEATQLVNNEDNKKCVDPILDIQLINYSDIPCIIKEVIFRHYGAWTEVKGAPIYGLLESANTYDISVSFDKPVSVYPLNPPLFIGANSPARFKLRLKNFNPPGSDTLIQFGLGYNNNQVCDTPIIHMNVRGPTIGRVRSWWGRNVSRIFRQLVD